MIFFAMGDEIGNLTVIVDLALEMELMGTDEDRRLTDTVGGKLEVLVEASKEEFDRFVNINVCAAYMDGVLVEAVEGMTI